MPSEDLYKPKNYDKNLKYKNKYSPIMPIHPCRILVAGASGTAKSSIVLSLFVEHKHSPFDRTIWISNNKSLSQSKVGEVKSKMGDKMLIVIGLDEDIIGKLMEDGFNKGLQQLIVFDDLLNERDKTIMDDCFTSARHHNCSCCEITQRVFSGGGRTRRLQCNYFIITTFGDDTEPKMLINNLVGNNLCNRVMDAYKQSVQQGGASFFMIDNKCKTLPNPTHKKMRFRCNTLDQIFPDIN